MVYFIRAGQYVKIGYSKDPEKRKMELQTGNPIALTFDKIIEGEIALESKLHKIFKFYRAVGEWFRLPEGYEVVLEDMEEALELADKKVRKTRTFKGRVPANTLKIRVNKAVDENIIDLAIAYLRYFDDYTKLTDSRIARTTTIFASLGYDHEKIFDHFCDACSDLTVGRRDGFSQSIEDSIKRYFSIMKENKVIIEGMFNL